MLLARGPTRDLAGRPSWNADPGLVRSVLDGVLLKKTDSVCDIWQEREVVLTNKRLYFGEAPASVRHPAQERRSIWQCGFPLTFCCW